MFCLLFCFETVNFFVCRLRRPRFAIQMGYVTVAFPMILIVQGVNLIF